MFQIQDERQRFGAELAPLPTAEQTALLLLQALHVGALGVKVHFVDNAPLEGEKFAELAKMVQAEATLMHLFVPLSDRLDFSAKAVRHVNRTILRQMAVETVMTALRPQFNRKEMRGFLELSAPVLGHFVERKVREFTQEHGEEALYFVAVAEWA